MHPPCCKTPLRPPEPSLQDYRQPPDRYRSHRPEILAKQTTFKRAQTYLERYCWVLVFAAYLEDQGWMQQGPQVSWMHHMQRPEREQQSFKHWLK